MAQSVVQRSIAEHLATINRLSICSDTLTRIGQLLIESFRSGRRLYLLGNGGSAADAQHIAAELVGRFKVKGRPALPAIALTTDTSNLTAIGNDFGFDQVFSRQVEALVQPGDVAWALSVSGSSPNVIKAVQAARENGAKVIGFTGANGAKLKELCDLCLVVEHADSDRVQEAHQLAYHIICGVIDDAFAKDVG